MFIWILRGHVSSWNSIFILLYIIHESYCIFGMHLFLAYCTKFIHQPSGILMHLMVQNQRRVGHLQTRIRLSNIIFALHTKHRYGFTYGWQHQLYLSLFRKSCNYVSPESTVTVSCRVVHLYFAFYSLSLSKLSCVKNTINLNFILFILQVLLA